MKILLAAFLAAMAWAAAPSHAATVSLQTCTVAPTSSAVGSVAGCPSGSFLFAPVAPTTLVRSQAGGVQSWKAFSALIPTDQVYASDYAWHVLSSITPALQPASPVPPPVVTPPACPPPAPPVTTWAPMNWTCSIANGVATCTAPAPP